MHEEAYYEYVIIAFLEITTNFNYQLLKNSCIIYVNLMANVLTLCGFFEVNVQTFILLVENSESVSIACDKSCTFHMIPSLCHPSLVSSTHYLSAPFCHPLPGSHYPLVQHYLAIWNPIAPFCPICLYLSSSLTPQCHCSWIKLDQFN